MLQVTSLWSFDKTVDLEYGSRYHPYLTFDTFELLLRDSRDHQILRPPQRADESRSFRHSRIEFELIGVSPRISGVSGTESINCVISLLKVSMLCIALVSAGMLEDCSTSSN